MVEAGSTVITDDPVEPELAKENVVNRMVLVPAMAWPGLSEHGWVAKVTKLASRTSICSLKLHDGTYHFKLAIVLGFKPLS